MHLQEGCIFVGITLRAYECMWCTYICCTLSGSQPNTLLFYMCFWWIGIISEPKCGHINWDYYYLLFCVGRYIRIIYRYMLYQNAYGILDGDGTLSNGNQTKWELFTSHPVAIVRITKCVFVGNMFGSVASLSTLQNGINLRTVKWI